MARNTWSKRKKRWSQYYDTPTPAPTGHASGGLGGQAQLPFQPRAQPYAAPVVSPTLRSAAAPAMTLQAPSEMDALSTAYNTLTGSQIGGPGTSVTYGNGGGGGAAAGLPQDPMSGFAGNYTGAGLDILYSDPQVIVRDAMKAAGFNPNDGLMALMEDKAGMLQFLAMLGMGADPDSLNQVTPENFLNFSEQWVKDMLTPGKGSGDVWGMVQRILDAPEGSALQGYLQDGTPQQQAEALNTLVSVATASLPPVFRQAIGGMMEDRTNDWLSSKAKGKKNILADFLQSGGGGLLG